VVVAFRIRDSKLNSDCGEEAFHVSFGEPCATGKVQAVIPSAESALREAAGTPIGISACSGYLAPCGSIKHLQANQHVCRR
jgi:hypothetical protein